jgi:hypothetical protein
MEATTAITPVIPMPEKPVEAMTETEIIRWLRTSRTPLEMVETREGRGGQVFYYLRHQYVTETLNRICGFDWDFRILRERLDEDHVTVLGELTVRIGLRAITKCQYGSAEIERYTAGKNQGQPLSVGDAFKTAASDSLKKCASMLGLGLDLSLPIQDGTLKALHATGHELFSGEWDALRPKLISALTKGRRQSSKELTEAEARLMIAVLKGDKSSELTRETALLLRGIVQMHNRQK